jgi:catechol 2,3-dioxygenase-like lactoylglutathione lyase family enzyme
MSRQPAAPSSGITGLLMPRPSASTLILLASATAHAWQLGGGLRRPVAARASTVCASAEACGPLQRVVHRVGEPELVGRFYESCVGLEMLACTPGKEQCTVMGQSEEALCLELVAGDASGGYHKLCARVPSVDGAVAAVRKWCADSSDKASVLIEPDTVEHIASLVPEQPDDVVNAVKQATITDPSGATVLLWEAESDAGGPATLTGLLLEVYEWKASSDWYSETLGWSLLRHQSNVPLEAAMTLTVGAPSGDLPGVWGSEAPYLGGGVLMVQYIFGCKKIAPRDGLAALVVARAAGVSGTHELTDPDGNQVVLAPGVAPGDAPSPAAAPAAAAAAAAATEEWPRIGGTSGYHRMAGRLA